VRKKAQGLSLNVIIVATLGLIVLVILVAVFTGRIGSWGSSVASVEEGKTCDEYGGDWTDGSSCDEDERPIYNLDRDEITIHVGQVCCVG